MKSIARRRQSGLVEDGRQRIVKRANADRAAARKRGVHMGRKPKLTELQRARRSRARRHRSAGNRVGGCLLLLTAKVGGAASGDAPPGRTSQPTSDERGKVSMQPAQRSPREKETIRATAMTSNRRMFSMRSPVHKR